MRKLVSVAFFVLLISLSAVAADYPKAEVFGGFQYSHLELGSGLDAPGFNVAFNGNFNRWFGITADLGTGYTHLSTIRAVSVNNYTYAFGPTFSLRAHRSFTPYVHLLVGGDHASATLSRYGRSINGLAVMVGGGVDANVNRRLAFRVAQADWLLVRGNGGSSDKNFRLSTGVVFKF